MTRYEYDDAGRLVRSVAVSEPEWSREDVATLIVSRQSQNDYDENGFLWAEATDPANQFVFEGQALPKVNYATKARKDAEDAYYRQWDKKDAPVNRNGHIWGVSKKPDA